MPPGCPGRRVARSQARVPPSPCRRRLGAGPCPARGSTAGSAGTSAAVRGFSGLEQDQRDRRVPSRLVGTPVRGSHGAPPRADPGRAVLADRSVRRPTSSLKSDGEVPGRWRNEVAGGFRGAGGALHARSECGPPAAGRQARSPRRRTQGFGPGAPGSRCRHSALRGRCTGTQAIGLMTASRGLGAPS